MSAIHESAKIVPGPGAISAGDRSIGALLIDSGKLRPEDIERVLRYAKDKNMRFGDAAIALKLVSSDDIQRVLARQFDYPYLVPGESSVSAEVLAAWVPFSRQVESLRALRGQLLLRWFVGESKQKTLAVLSAERKEGRSHIVANLAVVFSQMGERTLLVDADMRNPRQHQLFGLSSTLGLSTLLSERSGLECIQRLPAFSDLSILTAGPTPPNPSELVAKQSFATLLAQLSDVFDVILIDTPAAVTGVDAQTIAARARGALFVVRKDSTRVTDLDQLADSLLSVNTTIVGTVLNAM